MKYSAELEKQLTELWERQCQTCSQMGSGYDGDTGTYLTGCRIDDRPEVEDAINRLCKCPGWTPYPPPCEFKHEGCEGIDDKCVIREECGGGAGGCQNCESKPTDDTLTLGIPLPFKFDPIP